MALLEKLSAAWSSAGTVWKAAAGCAICAALVAGVLEDVRHAIFRPVINLVDSYFSSPDDQFDACLSDHLRDTPRPAPGPFHVFVTVPQGTDGLGQFRLIDQNLRAQFGEDVSSVVQVESSDCLILQPASGLAAQIEETASRRGQAVLEQTGADVVIWGEVKNTNKKLRLRFLTKGDAADNTFSVVESADDLLLEPDFGEDVGALIAAKTLTLTALTAEERGGFLTPRMELALRITAPLVKAMPAGLDADARGAIQHAHGTVLLYLGDEKGDATLLEQAVDAYHAALTELTQDRAPLNWAGTQMNLGIALSILGARESGTERLEQAVEAYRDALTEYTQDRVPLQWAGTQMNLGIALLSLGEREAGTERLEQALEAFRDALTEWTQDRVPLRWAAAQMNLGIALLSLGERETGTERLELAVEAIRDALTEWTQDRVPLRWAAAQINLGNALQTLGRREAGTERLELAVEAYRAALKEQTRERVPLAWAMTQMNLGNALLALGAREEGTARLEEAVAAYRAALTEHRQDLVPLDWAMTQNGLGLALRILGRRETGTALLEQAVDAHRAALNEYVRDREPLNWAAALGNEGLALLTLAGRTGDPAQARQALEQLTLAEATLRSGGHIPWADSIARQIPAAQALVDRLSGGQP